MEDQEQALKRFNIRVYGILLDNSKEQVLVSKETYQDLRITKFPGGGLEFGEGIEDALKREFIEELELDIAVDKLLYINHFLQISAFNPQDQLIAIYYQVLAATPLPPNFIEQANRSAENLHFQWIPRQKLGRKRFSFPVDKYVAANLETLLGPIG